MALFGKLSHSSQGCVTRPQIRSSKKLAGVLQVLTCQSVPISPQEETAMTEHQMEGPPEEAESLHEEEETLASCEPAPEIPRENQTTGTCMLQA
jgi:hypothetical protein